MRHVFGPEGAVGGRAHALPLVHERRRHGARADGHDAEAALAHLEHQALGEAQHRVLRCTVRRATLDAVLPRERGDVHDSAGARVQHGLEERPRDEVERADVHPHRRVPVLERELHEGPEPPDPGVVHEHLRHAPFPGHERGERLHAGGIGHVARHADAVDALRLQVAYCGVYIGFGARADSDSRPRPPQCLCRCAPDPLGCAGHDGERAGKIHRGTNIRHPCLVRGGNPAALSLGVRRSRP